MATIQKRIPALSVIVFVVIVMGLAGSPHPPEGQPVLFAQQRDKPVSGDVYKYMDAQDASLRERMISAESSIEQLKIFAAANRQDISIIKDRQEYGNAMLLYLLGLVSATLTALIPTILGPFFRNKRWNDSNHKKVIG